MKPRVLLIDLSALFHPAWRANENGPVSVAFQATLGAVNRCIASVEPDSLVAICCDGKGNWRKELTPTYKAHREALPSVFYAEFDRVKQRLRDDGMLLWQADGYEADDLIAQAAGAAALAEHCVRIASHDKDMLQLVHDGHVDYLSTGSFAVMDEHATLGKFGVLPENLGDWLALVGDKSDGVAGCPGCGPVNAAKLLGQFGNLRGVFDAAHDPESDIKPAMRAAIIANDTQIELARKLVDFKTDAPIRFEEIYEKRETKPLTKGDDVGDIFDRAQQDEGLATTLSPPYSDVGVRFSAPEEKTPTAPLGLLAGAQETQKSLVHAPEVAVTVEYSKQLEPRTFREATIFAKFAFDSRLYQKFGSWEAIAMVIARGRDIGLAAGASLDVFHVIEGRPYPFAYLIAALCRKDAECGYLLPVEQDEKHAIAETKHLGSGKVLTIEYTYEQAVKAKLPREGVKGPNGWLKNPEDMLIKTALAKLGRRIYSGAALGLTSLEEIGEA